MAEDLGDKTEEPTAKRLSDARLRGQVAKSADLSAAIDLIGAAGLLVLLGGVAVKGFIAIMRQTLDEQGLGATGDTLEPLLRFCAIEAAKAAAPLLGVMVLVGLVSQLVQVGFLFSTEKLTPKFERLNPFKGFANLFGKRNLAKTVVNTGKLILVLVVGWRFLSTAFEKVTYLPVLDAMAGVWLIARLAGELTAWLLAILLAIGLLDFTYQKWQHRQDLRMTKSDVKEERRSMDGDPHVKGRRLSMARKLAMQRINSAVPRADVVVTNPTHFAVAIEYDSERMRAPKVVAKGADYLAMRIREVAIMHGVPIVERPPLARALFEGVDVGMEITPEYYQAVAEILAFVYKLDKQAA